MLTNRVVIGFAALSLFGVCTGLGIIFAIICTSPLRVTAEAPPRPSTRDLERSVASTPPRGGVAAGRQEPSRLGEREPAGPRPAPRRRRESSSDAAADVPPERIRRMVDTLADRVERESADPRWAGPAQAQIVASAEEDTPDGGVLLGARCRTSLCRVEVAFDSVEQRDAARGALPLLVPWDGEAMLYADTEDPTKVIIYAAREGMTLVTSRD